MHYMTTCSSNHRNSDIFTVTNSVAVTHLCFIRSYLGVDHFRRIFHGMKTTMDAHTTTNLNTRSSLGARFYRFVSSIGLFLCLGTAHTGAQAQQLPVVSCTSPNWVFNTGVNANTGAQLPQNATEPRWQYAPHPIENIDNYTPPANWHTPVVKRLTAYPWHWTNQGSAEWITPKTSFAATKYTYYRFRFNLDPAQDPNTFHAGFNFEADDLVLSAFINGTKVNSASIGGSFLPPDGAGRYYTRPNQYNINQGWQAGTNEIVLLVSNYGGSTLTGERPSGGLLMQGLAMCGGARISKAFSPTQLQVGGTSTLTIHVDNLTDPGRPVQNLLVKDELPTPLQIAGTPTTTCQNANLVGAVGSTSLTLERAATAAATADMLPTGGCDITVPVSWPVSAVAQCTGNTVTNTITPGAAPTGQFSTALGFDPTPANASLQCIPLPLTLNVQTTGTASGPFNYTLAGTVQASGSATTATAGTPEQVDGDSATAGMQPYVVTPGTDLIITQSSLPAGWALTSASCTRDGMNVGSLTGDTYTVPAAEVHGTALACTFINAALPGSLLIGKTIAGGTPAALAALNGAIDLSITCDTGFTSTASLAVVNGVPGNATVTGIPAGSVCTVAETGVPTAPAGFAWDGSGVAYAGNPATIGPAGQAQVNITNPLKAQTVTPVPSQSWPTLLLMALGVLTLGSQVLRRARL